MTIDCPECGIYQAGNYMVDELGSLRQSAAHHHWIQHFQKEISRSGAGEMMKISKIPGHESYIVEPSTAKKLSRMEKKIRRPGKVPRVTAGLIYIGNPENDEI
ncbi:MAG: hypothetical protein ACK5HY_03620 [Parahaliea sp.]